MEVAKYDLGTQNRKFIIFLQYIHILRKECHSCFCVFYDAKRTGMCATFRKKGKKGQIFKNLGENVQKFENILKKGRQIFENLGKTVQNLKIF